MIYNIKNKLYLSLKETWTNRKKSHLSFSSGHSFLFRFSNEKTDWEKSAFRFFNWLWAVPHPVSLKPINPTTIPGGITELPFY